MTDALWRGEVVVAYLDEPPFGIPPEAGSEPSGCDMELAAFVLRTLAIDRVSYVLTTFPELIPGLVDGRWHVATPMFVTEERAQLVDFSRPVWAVGDGLIVRRGDERRFGSYETIAAHPDAILAVVTGQVQRSTARSAGVPAERIVEFADQEAAVEAVRRGQAQASASTSIGSDAFLRRAADPVLAAVADTPSGGRRRPAGAFAIAKAAPDLKAGFDEVLAEYVGTPGHLELMARYGFGPDDIPRA